jgi:hypothetical protein
MKSTRPRSASRRRSDLQNCSNRVVGTCESHAEKKITSKRAVVVHAGDLERDIRGIDTLASDRDHLRSRIDRSDGGRPTSQRRCPEARAARDLQDIATGPHLRDQPIDTHPRRGHIAICRHVVLVSTLAVVTHLLRENLVDHHHIMTVTSLPAEAAQQFAQRAAQPAQVGQLAVRAQLVDEARYQLGQLGLGVLV